MTNTWRWMALALLVACGGKDTDVSGALELEGDAEAGSALFSNCSGCHGADGSGVSGPSLIDHVPAHSDEEILSTILEGSGSMPSFEDFSDQELADLLAYLRETFGG